MSIRITGKLPSGKLKERILRSPNYKKGSFQNLSPTVMLTEDASYWKMLKNFFQRNPSNKPPKPVPVVKTDLLHLKETDPVLIWFGHSSYLLRIQGKTFLIDPVLSGSASPVSFMIKAFAGSHYYTADKMPEIDYLILTHDHYDHLDYKTITRLKNKTGRIICSLGLSSHLRYWGVDKEKITETDWWDEVSLPDEIKLIAAPARHFSGRGVKRAQTLWSSFILKAGAYKIYLGGDSGYDFHFSEIGNKYGPFDLAILECGQYNTMWPQIHMMPEETVRAAQDLQAKVLLPVHWGKFSLAMHDWNEPITRAVKAAHAVKLKITTPQIGEKLILGKSYPATQWWKL